ncbi:segregation/condensation protein A [bacterium]|nr:segregation/condensation protein A [bacterium]MCI0565740.1 segregation/condensation protein A [bacterium]MCI0679872.1 segregation/condensation protein A [bacterium]
MAAFEIKIDVFEGPLDLLLSLIEKRKLFINDVSLSAVADDFLSYLENRDAFPTKEAAEFLLIASTLVLLKSRSLMPALSLTEEEKGNIEELEDRLKKLAKIRELAHFVRERYGRTPIFPRRAIPMGEPVFSPHPRIQKETLLAAVRAVLENMPREDSIPQAVVKKIVRLEDIMENLAARVQKGLHVKWSELKTGGMEDKNDKIKIIMHFLALLELIRRGIIAARQDSPGGDIAMESGSLETPHYG